MKLVIERIYAILSFLNLTKEEMKNIRANKRREMGRVLHINTSFLGGLNPAKKITASPKTFIKNNKRDKKYFSAFTFFINFLGFYLKF